MSNLKLSYSCIKDMLKLTPLEWKAKWLDRTTRNSFAKHFVEGALIDVLTLTPHLYEKQYVLSDIPQPSDALVDCVQHVLHLTKEDKSYNIDDYEAHVSDWIQTAGYYPNRSPEKVLATVKGLTKDYFAACKQSEGKTVIHPKTLTNAQHCREALLGNAHVRPYLDPDYDTATTIHFQLDLKARYEPYDYAIKAKLDILQTRNDWQRTVDLKSVGWCPSYQETVRNFRYDMQVDMYDYMVADTMKQQGEEACLLPPVNIVVDKNTHYSFVYTYEPKELIYARRGSKAIPGWQDLVDRIHWHISHDLWDASREQYERGVYPMPHDQE